MSHQTCQCTTCGYEWPHGQSGAHRCEDTFLARITKLQAQLDAHQRNTRYHPHWSKEEMDAIDALARQQDLEPITIVRQGLRLYQLSKAPDPPAAKSPTLPDELTPAEAQIETLLTPWLAYWRTLDGTFEAQHASHGADPEAPFWKAVYSLFDAYTEQLATQVGDTAHWLHWFIYDNDAGANAYQATTPTNKKPKRIRTLKDLAHLLATP
jgi:hypothetical protein